MSATSMNFDIADQITYVETMAASFGVQKFPDGFLGGLYASGQEFIAKTLYDMAFAYAEAYAGTFEYLADLSRRIKRGGGFTDAQAKGVLNCMLAEGRRRRAAQDRDAYAEIDREISEADAYAAFVAGEQRRASERATGINLAHVPTGIYTLVGANGGHFTIRVQEPRAKDDRDGTRFISYLSGTDNTGDYTGFATQRPDGSAFIWARFRDNRKMAEALATLAATGTQEQKEGMFAYALASGRCARCNRVLTNPDSITTGFGPECEGKAFQ